MTTLDPQMNTYKSFVITLGEPNTKEEIKLKAAQELSENLDTILASPHYPAFLAQLMKICLHILRDGQPQFIAEHHLYKVRKLILEILQRLPKNEYFKPYVSDSLKILLKLLQIENEENVVIAIKVIFDLYKQFKPPFHPEILQCLHFIKLIYNQLPINMPKMLQVRPPVTVNSLVDLNIESHLKQIFTITTIQTTKASADGNLVAYNLVPRSALSLKFLQEFTHIIAFWLRMYRQNVEKILIEIVPLVANSIILESNLQDIESLSFNKEVFLDFVWARIRCLTFLGAVYHISPHLVRPHSSLIIKGIFRLFNSCPKEASNIRKELLIGMKHFMGTDLKTKFIPYLDVLLDEKILSGSGTQETFRPTAIITVGDYVHHVRYQLSFPDIKKVVNFFSKRLHDQSLPSTVQIFSSRVLFNFIECIKVQADNQGRDLLIKILDVYVLKFEAIAKLILPTLANKSTAKSEFENLKPDMRVNVTENRNLIKYLVLGTKSISYKLVEHKVGDASSAKQFHPKDTLLFIRMLKWSLQALDVYKIDRLELAQNQLGELQKLKLKEEKELLDHFFPIFTVMNPLTFREIFSTMIEYMMDCTFKNRILETITNGFLVNPVMSPIFGAILSEYLLERMVNMGSNSDRSDFYLRYLKIVFGSVSFSPVSSEHMLSRNLQKIVENSLKFATIAKEPLRYFLLLRALFRSICGGSHDLLYQKFLPFLPKLLDDLNRFQCGVGNHQMKELLIELVLTVPVRLSSLLPYLSKLANPIVFALSGSPEIMSQALRTLELCVDNLETNFFYAQFRPVREDLIQSLWRIVRDSSDQSAQVAFRILGKLGGENRCILTDPQKIKYNDEATNIPAIVTTFEEYSKPIGFSVDRVVATAYMILNSSADAFYQKQAWQVVNSYLAASIQADDDQQTLFNFFNHSSFKEGEMFHQQGPFSINKDSVARNVQKTALSGLFLAVLNAELKTCVFGKLIFYLRHYTMVAIALQVGSSSRIGRQVRQDPFIIIDAIKIVMGQENKELGKFGHLALSLILETATTILGSKERACQLPLMEYLAEKMTSLCYEQAWYTKLGGCVAISFFSKKMSFKWILNHLINFVKALIFVIMDLSEEISNGTIDVAKTNLEQLLRVCADPGVQDPEILETQTKSLGETTRELMRHTTSPHSNVREEAIASLGLVADIRGITITELMKPHKVILTDVIPPIKHRLVDQPVSTQIGLLEGNTFCMNLSPPLFNVNLEIPEQKMFYQDLLFIIMFPDDRLLRKSCYQSVTDFTPLKKAAVRAFASYQYLPKCRDDIFKVLYTALDKSNEIGETAFECMKKLNSCFPVKKELVNANVESMVKSFKEHGNLKTNSLKRLVYMSEIFPHVFSGILCDQMFQHLKVFVENLVEARKGVSKSGEMEVNIVMIIELLEKTPTASAKWISPICKTILGAEKKLMIEACSPFRLALLRFLLRYPSSSLEFFLKDNIDIESCGRFLEFLLKNSEGKPFRDCIQQDPGQLRELLFESCRADSNQSLSDKSERRYRAINILSILIKFDSQWLLMQNDLVLIIRQLWEDEDYQTLHNNVDWIDTRYWKEPKLITKILLHFFRQNPNDIDLLFQLLRAFSGSFTTDFEFLKDFLQNTVAQYYTVEWKRNVFFKFVEYFPKYFISQELKAAIIKYILIPCFAASFEKGEGTKLMGGSPTPDKDVSNNVVSVFINQIIAIESKFEDSLRIYILRFACLLVEKASTHIHDVTSKSTSQKVRRLMCFAWPCLSTEKCVDPVSKYHGHLLLSHIIAKFCISEKIVIQVFYSLLKAFAVEARLVVREAFEVLFPALAVRMKEGSIVMHTKNAILSDGYTTNHLCHILSTIVRNYKAYYPERHQLVHILVNSISKLGSAPSLEQRTVAVDISEIIIKWELESESVDAEGSEPAKRFAVQAGNISPVPVKIEATRKIKLDAMKRIDSHHANVVLNFLFQLCCELHPTNQQQANQIDFLTTRAINLLKLALNPKMWFHLCKFKISWLQKIFASLETPQPSYEPICKVLELLSALSGLIKKKHVLSMFSNLESELGACVSSSNTRVQNLVFALLSKLMVIFPPEPISATVACRQQKLDSLYQSIAKLVRDALSNYEKDVNATFKSLSNSLTLLNAACTSNPNYIDGLSSLLVRVVYKMTIIHTNSRKNQIDNTGSDLLILSLVLLKNKVGVMQVQARKMYFNNILVDLIDRSEDVRVMKAIVKIIEEWIQDPVNQHPCLREKSLLLFRLMQNVQLRFSSDLELVGPFLEIVLFIYKDEILSTTELTMRLEPAFLSGLRSTEPQIRIKFFDLFNRSIKHQLLDRLLYIVCSQGWDMIGRHYWIKQCIELLMVTASPTCPIELVDVEIVLPSIKSLINSAEEPAINCIVDTFLNKEPEEEDWMDLDLKLDTEGNIAGGSTLTDLVIRHGKFLDGIKSVQTREFLTATIHLCHMDTNLAEHIWLDTFPKIWGILRKEDQSKLNEEVVPFVCSGSHLMQKDCHPSAVATFLEALSRCNPPIPMKPAIMKYLAKSHNIWHRMTLNLEQMMLESKPKELYEFEPVDDSNNEVLDALSDMYSLLSEDDMWSGLWQKYAHYKETKQAIALEQQGFFEQAQGTFALAMSKFKTDFLTSSAPVNIQKEVLLWEEHWIRCAKELGQWDLLSQYVKTGASKDLFLILDSCWRFSDWNSMLESLEQVRTKAPKEMNWKINLYEGFLAIHCPGNENLSGVDKCAELASASCICEWRRLPHVVGSSHLPLLQASQKIIELQEAMQVQQSLLLERESSYLPLKSIVQTWKNRFPSISDDLVHWSDIFAWRELHYKAVVNFFDSQPDETKNLSKHFIHAWAQVNNMFGRIARKHNLSSVCLDSLTKIHRAESVTIVDCYQKIKQQVKCYLQMASIRGSNDLKNALNCIESTEMGYFKKGINSELFALKGKLFSLMGDSDEANKAFSASVQMNENSVKAWALWGDYLEQVFIGDPSQIAVGVSAITCFIKAIKHHKECKSKKQIAKVLWLLNYDDENKSLLQQVDKSVCAVHPIHWLPWIPQILMWLMHIDGEEVVNLLNVVGRMYPQAVYFPIRTLYVTLKAGKIQGVVESQAGKLQQQEAIQIEASKPMVRCLMIMKKLREIHPIVISSCEAICEQVTRLREPWYGQVKRELQHILTKCWAVAFENQGTADLRITSNIIYVIKKLVATFGLGMENISSQNENANRSATSETLARRIQVTCQDPVFQRMKKEFAQDFDLTREQTALVCRLIPTLKKWIKILEDKAQLSPRSFLLEAKCRFLRHFSLQTADIVLPGGYLFLKYFHHQVKICKFLPRVEIVQRHNSTVHRLLILGDNGRIYPYLIVMNDGSGEARREERVLQLLRMLNLNLRKQKETCRRSLQFTVPKVISLNSQMQLVEDNPSAISMMDMYKEKCEKSSISHDADITLYYERLDNLKARGVKLVPQVLRKIYTEVQTKIVPKTVLRDWAVKTFPGATEYWTFRKMFTLQVALVCFAEYALHLSRIDPDMIYLYRDSGLVNVSYFKFDLDKTSRQLISNRPVPFRLTPNILEFVSDIGVLGTCTGSTIATARCLVQPSYQIEATLRAILRDEIFDDRSKKFRIENVVKPEVEKRREVIMEVTRAVTSISKRLNSLAYFDGNDSKVKNLFAALTNPDNLCQMDPTWRPWL